MAYIFMDESGCLGFDFTKPKTSKNFIITFLFIKNDNVLDKIVGKTFRAIPPKKRRSHSGTLHCNKEDNKTRMRLFSLLRDKDLSVMIITLNKKSVYTPLQEEKTILYNYVTNILLDRIATKKLLPQNDEIQLIASQRETNKFLNINFKQYLENHVAGRHHMRLKVSVRPPSAKKGLQVVDFISWAIFRKYEHQDDSFYNIIKLLIVEENVLFG